MITEAFFWAGCVRGGEIKRMGNTKGWSVKEK